MNEIIQNIKLIVGLPHWLSLQQQSILSIDALVWRCILGLAPAYSHVLTFTFSSLELNHRPTLSRLTSCQFHALLLHLPTTLSFKTENHAL